MVAFSALDTVLLLFLCWGRWVGGAGMVSLLVDITFPYAPFSVRVHVRVYVFMCVCVLSHDLCVCVDIACPRVCMCFDTTHACV